MYVLTINNNVILGPIGWNPSMFSSAIEDETGLSVSITQAQKSQVPLDLGNGIKVRHAIESRPSLNSKIQMYEGPTWSFTESTGTATYSATSKQIPLVKSELSATITANRYTKEVAGTTTTIQGTSVTVDTMRGVRDVFVQKYLLMGDTDTVMWKFPETWLQLTKAELGQVVTAGVTHVESMFVWEATKLAEIEAATTLEALDAIELM